MFLPHTISWLKPNYVTDASGHSHPDTFSLQDDNIAACVQPVTAQEKEFYLQRGLEISHKVFTDAINTYTYGDRLNFNDREMRIIGVMNLIELDRVIQIDCLENPSTAKEF